MSSSFPSYAAATDAYKSLLSELTSSDKPDAGLVDRARDFIEHARLTGKIIDDDRERADLQSAVNYWMSVITRHSDADLPDPLLEPFDESKAPILTKADCPYIGLRSFESTEGDRFAGRDSLVMDLVGRLKEGNILLLSGTSGSGKSSLISAGVLPALRSGALEGSKDWHYFVPFVPGVDPIDGLARALVGIGREGGTGWYRLSDKTTWVEETSQNLKGNPQSVVTVLGPTPSCLFVDQFEEVFSTCRDDDLRRVFLQVLELASKAGHKVILTMRSEYVEDKDTDLPEVFRSAIFSLDDRILKPEELREMIEIPASKMGLKIDPEVTTEIVSRLCTIRGSLPILQITLMELWDNRTRNRVTYQTYVDAVGDPLSLLDKVAQRVYQNLPLQTQTTADRILTRLVQPGPLDQIVSSRVPRTDFSGLGAAANVQEALDALVQARLVRKTSTGADASTDLYEIAHEAIVRNWAHLADLVQTSREKLKERLRLSALAEAWESQGRSKELLLSGSTLDWALKLEGLNDQERAFIEVSKEHTDAATKASQRAKVRMWTTLALYLGVGVIALLILLVQKWNALELKDKAVDQLKITNLYFQDQNEKLRAANTAYQLERDRLKTSQAETLTFVEAQRKIAAEQINAMDSMLKNVTKEPAKAYEKGKPLRHPTYIVWHSLQAPGDPSPEAIIRYDTAQGFVGPAHHFYISLGGKKSPGRGLGYQGYQVRGFNSKSIGILFNGDGRKGPLTKEELEAGLAKTLELMEKFNIKAQNVIGHDEAIQLVNDGSALQSCPGKYVDMNEIRKMLGAPPGTLPEGLPTPGGGGRGD